MYFEGFCCSSKNLYRFLVNSDCVEHSTRRKTVPTIPSSKRQLFLTMPWFTGKFLTLLKSTPFQRFGNWQYFDAMNGHCDKKVQYCDKGTEHKAVNKKMGHFQFLSFYSQWKQVIEALIDTTYFSCLRFLVYAIKIDLKSLKVQIFCGLIFSEYQSDVK